MCPRYCKNLLIAVLSASYHESEVQYQYHACNFFYNAPDDLINLKLGYLDVSKDAMISETFASYR